MKSLNLQNAGVLMAGEVSYFSRFMVKFVEITAAGFASALSAYLIAHFGGAWLSSSPPAPPAAVQVAPAAPPAVPAPAVQQAASPQTQPAAQEAAAPQPLAAPQQAAESPAAPPAPKAHKAPRAVASHEEGRSPERKPAPEKSAEELARAALSKIDAAKPPAAEPSGLRLTRVPPAADAAPRRSEPAAAAFPAPVPATTGSIQPTRPAEAAPTGAAPALAAPVVIEPRPVAAGGAPASTSAATPAETAAARPGADADQQGVLSRLVRLPDLLRPEPPPPAGEVLRPPAPIGPTSRE